MRDAVEWLQKTEKGGRCKLHNFRIARKQKKQREEERGKRSCSLGTCLPKLLGDTGHKGQPFLLVSFSGADREGVVKPGTGGGSCDVLSIYEPSQEEKRRWGGWELDSKGGTPYLPKCSYWGK